MTTAVKNKLTIGRSPPPTLVIDKGLKDADMYEYYPMKKIAGIIVPSFDIGKKHFGIYIHSMTTDKAVYAAVWKLGEKMDIKTQNRLTMLLDKLSPFFLASKVVLVEAQRMQNYVCVRLQQHLLTYLELRFPHLTTVNVASDIKYRKCGGPLGDQKHKRKQWAIDESLRLFDVTRDPVASIIRQLEVLKREQKDLELKGDDICDSYLQFKGCH
jgi:hypothetical protein